MRKAHRSLEFARGGGRSSALVWHSRSHEVARQAGTASFLGGLSGRRRPPVLCRRSPALLAEDLGRRAGRDARCAQGLKSRGLPCLGADRALGWRRALRLFLKPKLIKNKVFVLGWYKALREIRPKACFGPRRTRWGRVKRPGYARLNGPGTASQRATRCSCSLLKACSFLIAQDYKSRHTHGPVRRFAHDTPHRLRPFQSLFLGSTLSVQRQPRPCVPIEQDLCLARRRPLHGGHPGMAASQHVTPP